MWLSVPPVASVKPRSATREHDPTAVTRVAVAPPGPDLHDAPHYCHSELGTDPHERRRERARVRDDARGVRAERRAGRLLERDGERGDVVVVRPALQHSASGTTRRC